MAEDLKRFKKLDFEGFRRLAEDDSLTQYERIGFPDSYREGHEAAIHADIIAKLRNLGRERQTVADIGPGCSGLPHMLIDLCRDRGHELILIDSPEMLNRLPDAAFIRKAPARFPQECSDLLHEYAERIDVVLTYSVLHYVFVEASVFDFLDRGLGLLAHGGEMLIGDIPNASKRKRFFNSPAGIAFHQQFMNTSEEPEVIYNRTEPGEIDDSVMAGLLLRARAAGFDAYIVAQNDDLPMANRREDLLIKRP